MPTTLYYIHDPMCSWCWGFRPTREQLQNNLPAHIRWQSVLGGLAPDSDKPMPEAMQNNLQAVWRRITNELGTTFNFDFWTENTPRRSTYPACRAVIAARNWKLGAEMTLAIQQAYYLHALNPSDDDVLIGLAQQLGISAPTFSETLYSPTTQATLLAEINLSRQLQHDGFPSLRLAVGEQLYPIALDYRDCQVMLAEINRLIGCSN